MNRSTMHSLLASGASGASEASGTSGASKKKIAVFEAPNGIPSRFSK